MYRPVDSASLVAFRIGFGSLMAWEAYRYLELGRVERYYMDPIYTFTYWGFDWIQPWAGEGMIIHFWALGIFALLMMVGYYYRLSAWIFFFAFTYVSLLDKAKYLNHFYLIALISFLMAIVPAHASYSVDARRNPKVKSSTVPFWSVAVLRMMVGIAYLYGGIAKLNADWLQGWPMRMWVASRDDVWFIGDFATHPWAGLVFSYGGLIVDLILVPMLLWPRTRIAGFMLVLVFNLMNQQMFTIGIFPWFMMAGSTIFFNPDWPKRALEFLLEGKKIFAKVKAKAPKKFSLRQQWVAGVVLVFAVWQILFPFRHFLYPGNVSWTEEGHMFAWHMKLRSKQGRTNFTVVDPNTYRTFAIELEDYLTDRQIRKMTTRPDMMLQFAYYIEDVYKEKGIEDPAIYVDAMVRLNGRPYQQMIDPTVDLTTVSRHPFQHADWILPLTTPLPHVEYE